jgi:hypothetical protein
VIGGLYSSHNASFSMDKVNCGRHEVEYVMISPELTDAETWIHSRNGAIRRVPAGEGGNVKVIVSAAGLSRQKHLQNEQPGEYEELVVALVSELKAALANGRLRPCR